MMITDTQVLTFFRDAISLRVTWLFKPIPVELDTPLQSYAEWDELPCAIEDFRLKFAVDTSVIDFDHYYPWDNQTLFKKLSTLSTQKPKNKPLTIRMFAESARAGVWLFD